MKRLSMAMTALAVMGLMTMVSCRKPNVNNVVPGAARTVTFNATTESGNGSKTYLEDRYVNWSAGDQISVNGNDDNHKLTLEDGAGTTFGRFTGTITATAPYLVGYPADATNNGSQITFTIPKIQGGDPDFDSKLPMAAYTTDENADLQFKNMVNVLKLDLTGSQTITKIEVESATENLSGTFTVGTDLTPNYITSGTKNITVTKGLDLSDGQKTVYVVLPVFRAEGPVTLTFKGSGSLTQTLSSTLAGSTTPNHRYSASVNVMLETPWSASVVTIPVCAVHKNCASSGGKVTSGSGIEEQGVIWAKASQLGSNDLTVANCTTYGGGKYVHNYEYATGSFTPKPKSSNTFTGFMSGLSADTKYYVRAYIRKGNQVVYGDDVTFTTLASEPTIGYVDLGLPSGRIWATCNLGATTSGGYGDYYMWGDLAACTGTTSDKAVCCDWQSYRYEANPTTTFTKYCPTGSTSYWYSGAGSPDNNLNFADCTYADDCVRQTLGGDWRMPTTEDWKELYDNTTMTWTKIGGVWGWRFLGKGTYNIYYIFLPAAGYRCATLLLSAGSDGYYYSSSLYSDNPENAYAVYFEDYSVKPQRSYSRYTGMSVRPVR